MSKCESCVHLTKTRRLNPICLDCVLTPNFSSYEERKSCLTNREKLASEDRKVVMYTLSSLLHQLEEYQPQCVELYILNWLTRSDL